MSHGGKQQGDRAAAQALPGLLVVLSGPAGAGKTTVGELLCAAHPEVQRVVTATTRTARGAERDGLDYLFWDEARFDREAKSGGLLESAEVHGRRYGTPAGPVREALRSGQIALLIIDVDGAAQVKKQALPALFVFLDVPDAVEHERRLRGRGTEDEAAVQKRLGRAARERAAAPDYEHRIENVDAAQAARELWRLIHARR